MTRLDSLSQEELNKLYTRSAYVSQLGTLLMVIVIIYSILNIFSPWKLLISVPLFAVAYVFKYVRTPAARIFFYVFSISGIVLFGLSILLLFFGRIPVVLVGFLGLLICVAVLTSAKTDALFGPNYFTHKQIVLARKKKRKNENFTDEDLPKSLPNPTLAKICVVIAFILEAVGVFCFIGQFFIQDQFASPDKNLKQAYQAVEQKNYDEAFKLFQKAAENNLPEGHYGLGLCYANAWGTSQNTTEAANHFEIAADKELPDALYWMGMIYYYGNGRTQDFAQAASLLERSADQGNKDAQEMLSYQDGKKPDTGKISFAEQLKMKFQLEMQK